MAVSFAAILFFLFLFKNVVAINVTSFNGDFLKTAADLLNAGTQLPIVLARLLNINGGVPTLVNPFNLPDIFRRILPNFKVGQYNEDANLDFAGLVKKYGRNVEEFHVTTEDGYVLMLFRISKRKPETQTLGPIFLMHGLLGSADDWLLLDNENNLPYLLLDRGYDVWVGNARGNKYNRKHMKLSPSEAEFWDFSWHEIGMYDLPAFIDFILKSTGKEKLKYVGFSQGTTTFFVMASERPEYGAKVSLMTALSPVAFMKNAKSPLIRLLSLPGPTLHAITKLLGVHEFGLTSDLVKSLAALMCGANMVSEVLCSNVVFAICGFSYNQLDTKRIPIYVGHVPAGASVRQLVHYGQGVTTGEFRQFDYGHSENLKKYGSKNPPDYKLENIETIAIALFYSTTDWLAHIEDVFTLGEKISQRKTSEITNISGKIPGKDTTDKMTRDNGVFKNGVMYFKVKNSEFNHVDFVVGKDAILVYDMVMKVLDAFE